MRVGFGVFELDTTTFELRDGSAPVSLEPQMFDILVHLLTHRDRVVTKEELLDEVWGDRFVSESALTSRIKDVRRALGDDGRRQDMIKTVHGRGYRFVAPVTVLAADGEPDVPSPAGSGAPEHNLPAERTPLLGREAAVVDVADALAGHRLVSLLGIGGTGKSRLAVATGRHVLDRFGDGVWFVDLVPAGDEHAVATALARSAGLALGAGDVRDSLAGLLATRQALFVVDNCEHLRAEVAGLLDHLLDATSRPRFLVTSREPLGLPDERRVPVDPLEVGGAAAPAVALFLSSAERFGVTVPESERPTVERICRHLDGLPLAIELAAAQLRVLGPHDVAERLDQRFELLQVHTSPGRERHASLISVLDSTWALLEAADQDLLGTLAAFPGPFDLDDVEGLRADRTGAVASLMARLVDRSLVVSAEEQGRFRLLETVRLFAADHTDADRHATDHADWCLAQVGESMARHLHDFTAAAWCARHHDDLRAAEGHLLATGRTTDAALLICGAGLAMHVDAGARAADILPRVESLVGRLEEPALVARVCFTGVLAAMAVRSPEMISSYGTRAMRAADEAQDPAIRAVALVYGSWSTVFRDPAEALAMVEQARGLALDADDLRALNLADCYRAFHLAMARRYEEAIDQAEAVVDRTPSLDDYGHDTFVAIIALAAFNVVHDPPRARRWVDHLLAHPDPDNTMWSSEVLASAVYAANGELAAAADVVEAVRDRLARAGQDGLPDLLVPPAVLALERGEGELAAGWVRAIRDAGRVTQSFPITFAYRRIRQLAGVADSDPLADRSLEEVAADALAWMSATVEA